VLLSSLETSDDDAAIDAFDKAVEALKKALEINPDNSDVRQQLADMQMDEESQE
jgi:Tfp pilus assembly protein PilF